MLAGGLSNAKNAGALSSSLCRCGSRGWGGRAWGPRQALPYWSVSMLDLALNKQTSSVASQQ
jgi:hypothetical protein